VGQLSKGLPLKNKKWPLHSYTVSGQTNVAHPALADKCIKIGSIKISMKAVNKENERFAYFRQKFPKISEAKMKDGIFIGPQINYSKIKTLITK
jgi:hypothetical protein